MKLINESQRLQKLANIKEAKVPATTSTTIATKIDQNLDKIESLPVIQQTAEKIMNDPKLMQQFQQGLAKMGVNIDLMKEGEDIDSGMLSKIINAVANKEKQMSEGQDEFGRDTDSFEPAQNSLAAAGAAERAKEEYDDRGGAILRGLFGMPILAGALDYFANTGIINTISKGIGTNLGILATMAVGALIGGIVGAITHKKRQKQQESINSTINESQRLQKLAGILNENQDVEEGIGKALGTAALGAALALGSPEKGMAQKRPSTTQNIKQQSNEELVDTVIKKYQQNPVAAKEWSKKFKKQHLVLGTIVDAIERVTDRSQDIDSTTVERFGNYLKRYPRTTQEFLDAMSKIQESLDIDVVVNEALAKIRKTEK